MIYSLKIIPLILAAFVVGEDGVGVEAKHIMTPGQSISCGSPEGCVIMSMREFVQLTQDVHEMGENHGPAICKREI